MSSRGEMKISLKLMIYGQRFSNPRGAKLDGGSIHSRGVDASAASTHGKSVLTAREC